RVGARPEAADGGEGEGPADIAPVASARAALRGAVPDEESMSQLVRGPAHREVESVLAQPREDLPGPPPDVEIVHLERRRAFADQGRRRPVGPLAGRADLAVELPGRRPGISGGQTGLG